MYKTMVVWRPRAEAIIRATVIRDSLRSVPKGRIHATARPRLTARTAPRSAADVFCASNWIPRIAAEPLRGHEDGRPDAGESVRLVRHVATGYVAKQRPVPDECADERDRPLARLILRTALPVNRRNVAEALAARKAARTGKQSPLSCFLSADGKTLGRLHGEAWPFAEAGPGRSRVAKQLVLLELPLGEIKEIVVFTARPGLEC
jgi:hypothetical protein